MSELFYPKPKSKPYKDRFEQTSFSDQVCGILNPIVYALNKGKLIKPDSPEHKTLFDLLAIANGSEAKFDSRKHNPPLISGNDGYIKFEINCPECKQLIAIEYKKGLEK